MNCSWVSRTYATTDPDTQRRHFNIYEFFGMNNPPTPSNNTIPENDSHIIVGKRKCTTLEVEDNSSKMQALGEAEVVAEQQQLYENSQENPCSETDKQLSNKSMTKLDHQDTRHQQLKNDTNSDLEKDKNGFNFI